MLEVFILLAGCSFLAILYQSSRQTEADGYTIKYKEDNAVAKIVFVTLCVILVLFSGLRTIMNDTPTYINNFNDISGNISALSSIDYAIGSNPLFVILQVVFKRFISTNANAFLIFIAIIVNISFLRMFRKYSQYFSFSIFLYFAFLVFTFTMSATKQALATAIAVWAIPAIIENKRIKALLLIVIPIFIHPYVIVFLAAFFLTKSIWDRKTLIIILVTLGACTGFSVLIDNILNIATSIGDQYNEEMFTEAGVNIFRLMFYMIAPVMSFIFRDEIRKDNNPIILLSVNLCIVSVSIMIIASFGGANLFGRMANYFIVFHCILIPYLVDHCLEQSKARMLIKMLLILAFCVYYYVYYIKFPPVYGNDFFHHVSLFDVIENWRA